MTATSRDVYSIANTPFHPDGTIDFASQDRLIDHLLEQGAHELGLFGNASAGYTLASDERITLMKRISRRVDGRVPLVASSGHTGADAAVALSREMERLGADCLMVLPPHFLNPDGDGLLHDGEAISRTWASGDMTASARSCPQFPTLIPAGEEVSPP